MADEKDTKPAEAPKVEKAESKESTVQVESNGPSTTPPVAPVRVQEASLVGDEAIAEADSVDLTPSVVAEQVPAQVTGKQAPEVDTVDVHEVYVVTDEVITDTSDPRAVQIPDAGRGKIELPIGQITGQHVEDVFAREAPSS